MMNNPNEVELAELRQQVDAYQVLVESLSRQVRDMRQVTLQQQAQIGRLNETQARLVTREELEAFGRGDGR